MTIAANNLSPTQLNKSLHNVEHTALTLSKSATTINLITLYKPPRTDPSAFADNLHAFLQSLDRNTLTVIVGDFNYNLCTDPQHAILDIMRQYDFHQFVSTPTTDEGSLLDHVYVNRPNRVSTSVVDTYYSDHDLVHITLDLP